jgi:hypothetical protein
MRRGRDRKAVTSDLWLVAGEQKRKKGFGVQGFDIAGGKRKGRKVRGESWVDQGLVRNSVLDKGLAFRYP